MFPTSPAHQSSASAITGPICLSWTTSIMGRLYVSPGTSLCLCHCSPRGEATDFACWIISLRLAADAAENCYRMNSALPKLGSKDASPEHPCSRLHQLTNRVQALLPAQFA